MSYIIRKNKQGTDGWLKDRAEKMTSSNACAIGNNGKGLDTYINNLMAEAYSSAEKESYTNEDMERGNELEALARGIYEIETGNEVEEVGFIELDEFTGCSPDGLIGEEGGLEIKCLKDFKFFMLLTEGIENILSDYKWQIQMCLYVTGRDWWDLAIYCPNYKKTLLIHRFYPDKECFKKLAIGLATGKEKIKIIKDKYNKLIK